jgi:RNase H-like domain found in reverse transcriptase
VINNVYHTAYHKTTVHSNKTPCVTRFRLPSHCILPAEYNKQQLTNQVKLSYPKEDYDLVLCTDASEMHWSGVLTQVPKDQLVPASGRATNEPLGFLSGSFGGPSKSWSIVVNEAYAVVEAMIRFEHIVFGRLIHLYTDPANLAYISLIRTGKIRVYLICETVRKITWIERRLMRAWLSVAD